MVFPNWQCYNFGLIPTVARQRLRLMTVAKVILDGAFPARGFYCQSVHAVCARVWHTTQCACSVCWCVDRLQATGLRPTWHRPAARASEPPKKRLLRQQRVEESLESNEGAAAAAQLRKVIVAAPDPDPSLRHSRPLSIQQLWR